MLSDIDIHREFEIDGEIYKLGDSIGIQLKGGEEVVGHITDITRSHFWFETDKERFQVNRYNGKILRW